MLSVEKPRSRTVWWRWWLAVAYAGMIFLLSSVPGDDLPTVAVSDKLIHAVEFGILAVLLCRALEAQMPARSRRAIMAVGILATVFYGATDEMHQLLVARRMPDATDLAADSVGALLAAWGWQKAGGESREKGKGRRQKAKGEREDKG